MMYGVCKAITESGKRATVKIERRTHVVQASARQTTVDKKERKAVLDNDECVQLWIPELFSGTGGIQVFSRYFLDALCELVPAEQLQVLIKNDQRQTIPKTPTFGYYKGMGDWPPSLRTARFAVEGMLQVSRKRPQLIASTHLHFGPLARLIKKLYGIPFILVAHGIDAWQLNQPYRIEALRDADLVLSVSHYTRNWLLANLNLEPARVKILPNTFAPERFIIQQKPVHLLARYGFQVTTPVILMVCRLATAERYKGYDHIIAALPKILEKLPDARFLLVGTGPDQQRIKELVKSVGVEQSVIFAGFVPDDELTAHYNLCDVFAMPSKAEGFGIVYLEALGCGKPVLAGNKDGSRDALADGEFGVLIDPDDIQEIAQAIVAILEKRYSHPLIYQPELLRQRVIERFGFTTFKQTLHQHLVPFFQDVAEQE